MTEQKSPILLFSFSFCFYRNPLLRRQPLSVSSTVVDARGREMNRSKMVKLNAVNANSNKSDSSEPIDMRTLLPC